MSEARCAGSSLSAFDGVGRALVRARLACLAAFATMREFVRVFSAMRFAFAAELGAKLAEAGVPLRTTGHGGNSRAADVGAVQASERALREFLIGAFDDLDRAFVAGQGAEHSGLEGALHVLWIFFGHRMLGFRDGHFALRDGKAGGGRDDWSGCNPDGGSGAREAGYGRAGFGGQYFHGSGRNAPQCAHSAVFAGLGRPQRAQRDSPSGRATLGNRLSLVGLGPVHGAGRALF